jgi:hypothetical protein
MVRVLTKLRIDEVSAVDRGAGDGVKILLMKRDDTPRSKPHVERHARRLRKFEQIFMRKQLDDQEISPLTGAAYPRSRLPDLDDDDDRDDGDDDEVSGTEKRGGRNDVLRGDEGGGVSDHPIAQLASLLVASGKFSDNAAALHHLLNSPHGNALLARLHKAAAKTEKEPNMRSETLESIMKDGSIAGVCAAIVAKGSTTLTQDEIVESVSKIAHERWPELSEAQAFAKIHSDGGEEGRLLRSAIDVAKASLAETMLGPGLPVQVVGGPAAQDVDNATEAEAARAELMRIGRKQYPRSSENEIFERAFSDPRNATIVARLYQRPLPSSIYPMPREWLQGEGSQHAKADRSNSEATAYDDLMVKAEEYRNSHPELSISQAFTKVYTDRANVELAKRERVESAPR